MNAEGLIAFERKNIIGPNYKGRCHIKSLECGEMLQRYEGIEGLIIWSDQSIFEELGVKICQETNFADFTQIDKIKEICQVFFPDTYRIIYVTFEPYKPAFKGHILEKYFEFLGYDYGYLCYGCYGITRYSLIFNEILFRRFAEFEKYGDFLNEHLLFPDLNGTQELGYVREKLIEQGQDLEGYPDGHPYQPIAVWGIKGEK